jgi:ornithine decarboxylase
LGVKPIDREALRFAPIDVHSPLHQGCRMTLPHFASPEAVVAALSPSTPVYCVRPAALHRAARLFLDHFPGDVLYAVKCNPGTHILRELSHAGIRHFDTASLPEIEQIAEELPDATSYFMHPIKSRNAIESAYKNHGVRHYVVDHTSELEKISEIIAPSREVVILVRLAVHHEGAHYELSSKFGASVDDAIEQLQLAEKRGYSMGLAFHVGSHCLDPAAFCQGLQLVAETAERSSVELKYVDVGGGFPGNYLESVAPTIPEYLKAISDAAADLRLPEGCRLLCEPGRALAEEGESLIVQVQLRKADSIYLNEGIYGGLSKENHGLRVPIRVVKTRDFASTTQPFTAFGPTCDSLDVCSKPVSLPEDIREGDWLEFGRVGSYSAACRTHFNGFYTHTFVTVESEFETE